jgi:hypothetical protein
MANAPNQRARERRWGNDMNCASRAPLDWVVRRVLAYLSFPQAFNLVGVGSRQQIIVICWRPSKQVFLISVSWENLWEDIPCPSSNLRAMHIKYLCPIPELVAMFISSLGLSHLKADRCDPQFRQRV